MIGGVVFGAVVALGALGAVLSPVLKQQSWWPWPGNRKGVGT